MQARLEIEERRKDVRFLVFWKAAFVSLGYE